MIYLKSEAELAMIARAGAIIANLYRSLPVAVQPGRTTRELDRFAEGFIRDHQGAEPAFKGLYGFPATLCTSINHEVVHGIPSPYRRLADGDILSVDVGVKLEGWYADAAVTLPVDPVELARALAGLLRARLALV